MAAIPPRRRRVGTTLLGVVTPVLLAGVLAGCSATGDGPAALPPAGGPGDLPAEVTYVALGDSYSAGPMIPTMRADPTGCARSTNNYPAYLADWLDVAEYADVTCSGATTRDLVRRQRLPLAAGTVPPQLDALSGDTDLVTIGVGGNDRRIFARLTACATGDPGAGAGTGPGARCGLRAAGPDPLLRAARDVEASVRRVLARVAERAPAAEVYVVGYPQVLPERGSCRAAGLGPREAGRARDVQRQLNESLRLAAAAGGATYVDVAAASRGHDLCAGEDAWVNGPRMLWGAAAPYHPYLVGMQGVAGAVHEAVTGEPAPEVLPTEEASPDPDAVRRNGRPR